VKVTILREAGYEEALLGLSLSFNQPLDKMPSVARRLCHRDGGHNKFLETLTVWLDVTAPRYWWQQFDTYRVGMTKQSESTMHTILRRPLEQDDFEGGIYVETLQRLNALIAAKAFDQVKRELPEAFVQRRIVCTNYKCLRNMALQRASHRLGEWQDFIRALLAQLAHAELLADAEFRARFQAG
jgi:hypothetical protein